MFATVLREIADRHLSSQRTLKLIRSLEKTSQMELAATCKGLTFVQLYATYEYSVCSAVEATLVALSEADVEIRTLRRDLLPLILDSQWQSASEVSWKFVWDRRRTVIASIESTERTSTLKNDLFPKDGSHYRIRQLCTIWQVFSVSAPVVPEQRLIGRIDELVENRNAISHGRFTPEEVGGRYSVEDMAERVKDANAIAGHVVNSLEAHVRSGGLFAPTSSPR